MRDAAHQDCAYRDAWTSSRMHPTSRETKELERNPEELPQCSIFLRWSVHAERWRRAA
jgi:hypothetical protein